jgi:diamine N-acetyltransferase
MIGKNILLRALEPEDIDILYQWENDTEIWHLSNTITPFSRFVLEQYLVNSQEDIFTTKQLRLMIDLTCTEGNAKTIGSIDLFDFSPNHKRAGVGIMITKEERGKGYASESLDLVIDYSFNTLDLHQLFCNISRDNAISLKLFQKHGFEIVGAKKDWINIKGMWIDEYLLQLINHNEK